MKSLYDIFPELLPALSGSRGGVLHDSGLNAWIIPMENGWQIAIMHFTKGSTSDKSHVNDCSQWGVVLDGEMVLWSPRKRVLKKGDTFFISKGTPHRVIVRAGYKDITIFDGQRYILKQGQGP